MGREASPAKGEQIVTGFKVPADIKGLTENEVAERRANGLGNSAPLQTSRSYSEIIQENVFGFINIVVFVLGLALVALGRASDALVSVTVIFVNVAVSVFQEVRAKRTLDRIALLTRPTATVIRERRLQAIDPSDIVVGDTLVVSPGDQIMVDGRVIGDSTAEVDESLLTGEADLIPKRDGDPVYSGSFCVNGGAVYQAEKVGEQSVAGQLTSGARAFRRILTPLQREIALMIRVILLIAVYLEILLILITVFEGLPFVDAVKASTVIIGLVPNGLFLAIAIAYAIGAVRMVGKGVLVQQANAVESLSHVDVLCLDKTGTLTTNRIRFHAVHPFEVTEPELRQMLGVYVASASAGNRTSEAIASACEGRARRAVAEVPFSSARKWSSVSFDGDGWRGFYVLGAPELLQASLRPGLDTVSAAAPWMDQGLRVLLFAFHPDPEPPHDQTGEPGLPDGLVPLGLVILGDELRADVRETLAGFAKSGIDLKIISGDSPATVASLAKQAGLAGDLKVVSGQQLAALDEETFAQVAAEATVFGRITPQQKEQIVRALRAGGRYVAMIGDGVNDVMSLKQAQLGIAMRSGSQAARGVADIVLLDDSFAALPRAFQEGQRIVNGMQDILRLFLTRVFSMTLLIISIGLTVGFPFAPKHSAILTLLIVGVPSIALSAWAHPGPIARDTLIRRLLHFVLPATLTQGGAGLAVYLIYLIPIYQTAHSASRAGETPGVELPMLVPQTALTIFLILCGLLLTIFVQPPNKAWSVGDATSSGWKTTILALALFGVFVWILWQPSLGTFFELAPLGIKEYALIATSTTLWALLLRWMWRTRLLDRFFSVDFR